MKIALLHNVNRHGGEHEVEFDSPITIDHLANALETQHEVKLVEATRDTTSWVHTLSADRPDLVFNVAEGFAGAAREALFPALLENMGLDYSGPGPTELLVCHNKQLTKRLLSNHDIVMPWGALLKDLDDLDALKDVDIPFPLIVKLNSEGSSIAMDSNCIVNSWDELDSQVRSVYIKYGCNILIEQFISGRDLSCSFIEGLGTFGPVQYTYPYGEIYDSELKGNSNHLVGVINPNDLDASIREHVLETTSKVASALDINGYGRADFRLDSTNGLYFLEMNAQVSFHPDGAFVLAAEQGSHTFKDVVLHISEYAKKTVRRSSAIGR